MGYYLPPKSYLRPKPSIGIRQRVFTITTATFFVVAVGLIITSIEFGDTKSVIADTKEEKQNNEIILPVPLINSNPTTQEYKFESEIKFPVILAYFKALENRRSIELKWSTAQEVNNENFIIEKSFNGTTFSEIGCVDSRKSNELSSDYSFVDYNKIDAPQFYRLKQTSLNGKSTYIALEKVEKKSDMDGFSLYIENVGPLPFDNYFNIDYYSIREGGISVEIFDKNGKNIYKTYTTAKQGFNTCRFIEGNLLRENEYNIRIANSSGAFVKKIKKNI